MKSILKSGLIACGLQFGAIGLASGQAANAAPVYTLMFPENGEVVRIRISPTNTSCRVMQSGCPIRADFKWMQEGGAPVLGEGKNVEGQFRIRDARGANWALVVSPDGCTIRSPNPGRAAFGALQENRPCAQRLALERSGNVLNGINSGKAKRHKELAQFVSSASKNGETAERSDNAPELVLTRTNVDEWNRRIASRLSAVADEVIGNQAVAEKLRNKVEHNGMRVHELVDTRLAVLEEWFGIQ